ncbi:Leu/Phe/Val dehydrogenase [Stieleria neptunia]|uniref:Leu/Phe/Val dehydrogenase n=1 Tax=Stieleria neptunia TaxID=2527979 RepID=UPI0018D240F9|nr:Glu/Leu/Phe/Val dehydrogenase [Stieleria neptunia]
MVSCTDARVGLRAFIAIHNTSLGPALGGCRMWRYASDEEALTDALRLSQGMSYKHAVADTQQGGGKAVIMGDPRRDKSDALFQAFGRFVDRLGGQYVTAEDVGVSVDDMVSVRTQTNHVAGLPTSMGSSGDPSPVTAYGVYCGIQAAVAFKRGRPYNPRARLDDITVAVQGVGNVGYSLCRHLHDAGANLVVSDVHQSNVTRACTELSATSVAPEAIDDVHADVFAPCALGGSLNHQSAERLKSAIVAGAANNQLAEPAVAKTLTDRKIIYAPDYVINAGGIINISYEKRDYDLNQAMHHTERIGETLTEIFHCANTEDIPTAEVADRIAQQRLAATTA